MDILILGGRGFVGQYLTRELSGRNDITTASRTSVGDLYIPLDEMDRVENVSGIDIGDPATFGDLFKARDMVINLSGLVSFRKKDRQRLYDINHLGTINVLRECERQEVPRLVQMSSTAALGYGDSRIKESDVFQWPERTRCVYSRSKALSRKALLKSSIDTIIIYPPLILGPGDRNNTGNLIKAVMKGRIRSNPPGRNSIIDVRDLVKAMVMVLEKDIDEREFIVTGGNYTFKELNCTIAKVLGIKGPERTLPGWTRGPLLLASSILEAAMKDPPITYENVFMSFENRVHDTSRIREIGFRPKYRLEETIDECRRWLEKER